MFEHIPEIEHTDLEPTSYLKDVREEGLSGKFIQELTEPEGDHKRTIISSETLKQGLIKNSAFKPVRVYYRQ
ncbi:hypothetical protein AKO1_000507 [Acrasis kona]|uniref:Uncharacterized protein n=1 Tax=Acrasis kona TaxID=1008807 RepID=A0AAW2ZPQ8_9EUKA